MSRKLLSKQMLCLNALISQISNKGSILLKKYNLSELLLSGWENQDWSKYIYMCSTLRMRKSGLVQVYIHLFYSQDEKIRTGLSIYTFVLLSGWENQNWSKYIYICSTLRMRKSGPVQVYIHLFYSQDEKNQDWSKYIYICSRYCTDKKAVKR